MIDITFSIISLKKIIKPYGKTLVKIKDLANFTKKKRHGRV